MDPLKVKREELKRKIQDLKDEREDITPIREIEIDHNKQKQVYRELSHIYDENSRPKEYQLKASDTSTTYDEKADKLLATLKMCEEKIRKEQTLQAQQNIDAYIQKRFTYYSLEDVVEDEEKVRQSALSFLDNLKSKHEKPSLEKELEAKMSFDHKASFNPEKIKDKMVKEKQVAGLQKKIEALSFQDELDD